jgi:hypothetical protein
VAAVHHERIRMTLGTAMRMCGNAPAIGMRLADGDFH